MRCPRHLAACEASRKPYLPDLDRMSIPEVGAEEAEEEPKSDSAGWWGNWTSTVAADLQNKTKHLQPVRPGAAQMNAHHLPQMNIVVCPAARWGGSCMRFGGFSVYGGG